MLFDAAPDLPLHPPLVRQCLLAAGLLLALSGCGPSRLPGDFGDLVKFQDDVESNTTADPTQLNAIQLTKTDGSLVDLKQLCQGKNTLLVITRGLVRSATLDESGKYNKAFCTYCSTQTSRLIANYSAFKKRDTEVVLVFPVARQADVMEVETFATKVQGSGKTTSNMPFPIVLDIDLLAVDALGIRDDLSKPSTYILDADGQVRFAYIGKSISDRPSIKALLEQLDQINQ